MFSKRFSGEIFVTLSETNIWGVHMVTSNILLCFLEFPVGSVSEVCPYEQS